MAISNGKKMRLGTQSLIQVIQAFARHADDDSNDDDDEEVLEDKAQNNSVLSKSGGVNENQSNSVK